MKKILFVASECVPFVKTGGLADVVGSLPQCFDKKYFECRVVLPKYMCISTEYRDKMEYVGHFYMDMDNKTLYVGTSCCGLSAGYRSLPRLADRSYPCIS